MTENVSELAKALSAAQGDFINPPKDRENPYFKSRYATLDALQTSTRGTLAANGLSVTQCPQPDGGGGWVLQTTLLHSSGQSISSKLPLLAFPKGPQAAGSELTYMRRYAYAAILSIAAEEDDDGNVAQTLASPADATSYQERPKDAPQRQLEPANGSPGVAVGIVGIKMNNEGNTWFVTIGDFGVYGSGNSVWTRDSDLAAALTKIQGEEISASLRSKKPGSYQLVSYIPMSDQ